MQFMVQLVVVVVAVVVVVVAVVYGEMKYNSLLM